MKKRILSIALILCMLLSVLPQVVFAEGEESTTTTAKDITLSDAALHNADTEGAKWDYVYFGTYNNSPIKWRVLSTKGNSTTVGTSEDTATYKTADGEAYTGKALFMLSENTLFDTWFYGTTYDNAWLTSNLRNKMQNDIFSNDSAELKYVLKTTKTDSSETIGYINPYNNNQYSIAWGGSSLSEDTLFALSAREVEQYLGSGEKYANRASGNAAWWWLRSPHSGSTRDAGFVNGVGIVDPWYVGSNYGVRPALNLNLSSVLFTSAAVGGKSSNAAYGGVTGIFENKNYADITGNDGYKLTLLDESRSSFKASLKSFSGSTATVSYSGAEPGTNEYISVIIKNGNAVKYYGRVATVSDESDASGEVDITLPSDFSTANGDVLCVFNEQYNGDKNTDYASKLIDVLFDYTVNFDANGATGTMASQTMTYGATANLSANTFTRNGYTFNGWNTKVDGNGMEYSDGQSVTNLVSDASEKSVTLYAQWKIIDYNISYTLNDGTATNPTTYTVESEDITLTNPTKLGYTFTGWSGTGLTGENNMTVTIPKGSTGNRNYVAHYSVKSGYTVSFDVNGGNALADTTGVKWTDKILDVVPTPTRTGYTFKGWKHNNTDITADTAYKDLVADDTVTDITLTAQWEENSNYPVTPDTNGQFTLSPAEGEQKIVVTDKAGNQTEITVTVNDGHTYEWQNENGKYWQKCKYCGDETAKKDIPEITINGADKVCVTQDYKFSFTLPEGSKNAQYGYSFENMGSGGLNPNYENGVYYGNVSSTTYPDGETAFRAFVIAETADGYEYSISKTVTIVNEHTGGTADCTHKAKCEVCGTEYGEVNTDNHTTLKHTEAKAATVDAEGNIEYWYCEGCNRYFSDKDGKNEIKLADTVIAKLTKTDDDNKSPQTGDNSHMALWIVLLFISGGTLAGITVYRKKKKRFVK